MDSVCCGGPASAISVAQVSRQAANVGGKIRIFAAQEFRQTMAKIIALAPFAHVVLPRMPAPPLFLTHHRFVGQ